MSFAAVVERLRRLENPYPGLRPFETAESHLFFGRDLQVAELVGRLARNSFVAVIGVSGSGKSSLVRAGLIPALERAYLSDAGRRWRIVVTRPGGSPFDRLAVELEQAGLDPSGLQESSHGLIQIARQLAPDESLLVVVDQFEELFRYKDLGSAGDDARRRHDVLAAEAAEYVQLLLAASRHQPPIYVVLTMRSDYLGDCAEFRDLPETLNDCQYLVPRMTREQRKQAIEGPLGQVEIEPALVQRLLNEAGDEPDRLPILQHALMRTWNHWRKADPEQSRRIELQDYDDIGGLGGALNQHADELLAGMPLDVTATIFKRLTARSRGRRERRNPARLDELWSVCGGDTPERQAGVTAVVDRFRLGEATFLVPREGTIGPDTYIDITHESLIRLWKKLRDEWLPEERASAKTLLTLVERARDWKSGRGEVLIGLDLTNALQWDRERNRAPAWANHYAPAGALDDVLEFIRASEDRQREEQTRQRRERRRMQIAVTTAVAAVIGGGLIGAGVYQYYKARVAQKAAYEARILSAPSVADPLTRALLLTELGAHAQSSHLAIYQEAATAAIPVALLRYAEDELPLAAGFLADGRVAVLMESGMLWSWRSDGREDPTSKPIVPPAPSSASPGSPWVTAAAVSRQGGWIAAGLANGAVQIGRGDGAETRLLETRGTNATADSGNVSSLSFSRDGRHLAVGYNNNSARIWRLDSAPDTAPLVLAGAHSGPVSGIDFDAGSSRVATGSYDMTTRVWNLPHAGQRVVAESRDDKVTAVALSPDAAWVLTGYESGAVRISRSDHREAGAQPLVLDGHSAPVTSANFSPDGSKVATASEDRTARLWTLRSPEPTNEGGISTLKTVGPARVFGHDAEVRAVSFDREGTTLVTASVDGTARLWRSDPDEPRILGFHDERVESVALSPDARRVVSASDDHTARIWSMDGRSEPHVLSGHWDWVRSAAFNPVDASKVVTASDDGTLRLWDLASGSITGRVSQEASNLFGAAFDPRGERVVTAVKDGKARIWKLSDLVTGGNFLVTGGDSQVVELPHTDWVLGAAFSGDGTRIVTASRDGTVRVWVPTSGRYEPARVLEHPRGATVYNASFSPDGSRIVTAAKDGARVWRVDAPDPLLWELRHDKEVNKAFFSASGAWIVTVSKDGTARLWDSLDGSERLTLNHGSDVRAACVDEPGGRLVTATADGIIRVWRIGLDALKGALSQASTACLAPKTRRRFLGEDEDRAWSQYEACERRYGRTPDARLRASPSSTEARSGA